MLLKVLYLFALFFGVSIALTGAGIVAAYTYDKAYDQRIFKGVVIGSTSLDGLTYSEAQTALLEAIDQATRNGFTFRVKDEEIILSRTSIPLEDPDVATDLINCKLDGAIQVAYQLGRNESGFTKHLKRLTLIAKPVVIPMPCEANTSLLKKQLTEKLLPWQQPAVDARIELTSSTATELIVRPEQIGKTVSVDNALSTFTKQTALMRYSPIILPVTELHPSVKKSSLEPLLTEAPELLQEAPFTLTVEHVPFVVNTSTLAGLITATHTATGYQLTLSGAALNTALSKVSAPFVQEAKNGYLELTEQQTIKTFTPPKQGVTIDEGKTIQDILKSFASTSTKKIPIVVSFKRTTPKIDGPDAERLGIRDLLGIGTSYFDGSPVNRRKNIAKGKEKMNGILLAPGEEFSQLKALGPIDGVHGWLPELVIKGNKTTPEFGGGLCQIGSTSFRAAMEAGLKITQRRNHSYRVRYYEPIGTDATIYEPSPDFRFKNDTPAHILITTEMKGDGLYFSIWGTDDGRKASKKLSGAYNIIPAPATKYVETTDLAPGQKKCTESAHAGATAHVDYSVQYGDGTSTTERFVSVYRPWGAVCLIGVASLSAPAEGGSVESTPIAE